MSQTPSSICRAALLVVLPLLAGCSPGAGGAGLMSPTAASSPATAASPSSAAPSAVASSSSPSPPAATSPSASGGASGAGSHPDLKGVRLALERFASDFDSPLLVTNAGDGSNRLFVAEQGGKIWIVENGKRLPSPFLDVSDRTSPGGERGLLGLAFAPKFGEGGEDRVYIDYTDREGDTIVAELHLGLDADAVDPGTFRQIIKIGQPYPNHNGGALAFDPDGMLIVAMGDGGSGGDPQERGQNPDELLGKLLRLDVLSGTADKPYAIPADNPFVGRDGYRPEIAFMGMRNPWRLSFDAPTGDLWIGDVGQGAWEEVDVAREGQLGLNFGWNVWEGRHCYRPSSNCSPDGMTMPVAEYGHGPQCTIIGGAVYRGQMIPALAGAYLFGDYCSGTLYAIDSAGADEQEPVVLDETGRQISSFGADESGELYVADISKGDILKIVPAG